MKLEVDKLKPLLGITSDDTTEDTVLLFLLENVNEIILNYCNLKTLPDGLQFTAYRMAIDLYRNESLGKQEADKPVSSISEGDTSVSFSGSLYESSFTDSLLKKYEQQLAKYRRLEW